MQLYYDIFVEAVCNEYVTFEFCGYVKKYIMTAQKIRGQRVYCNLNGDQSDLNCRGGM